LNFEKHNNNCHNKNCPDLLLFLPFVTAQNERETQRSQFFDIIFQHFLAFIVPDRLLEHFHPFHGRFKPFVSFL
jgi:hypothetical protein